MSTMALKQVRDELRATADHADNGYDKAWATRLADAIDAHLKQNCLPCSQQRRSAERNEK